jgi:hypothetical protein
MHSGWHRTRIRVYRALQAAFVRYARLNAFATCGATHWLLRSRTDPDRYKLVPHRCHDRFCVPCSRARSLTIRRNILANLPNVPCRFITLTLRAQDCPLSPQVTRLLACYRRLRKTRLWRSSVNGAIAFFELTYNSSTLRWHPHLHVIACGHFIPQRALSEAWLRETGDSPIVDIRYVTSRTKIASYVAKYATKPLHPSILRHPDALVEAIRALEHRKTISPSGRWARLRLLNEPSEDSWELVCHEAHLPFADDLPPELVTAARAALERLRSDPNATEFALTQRAPP